MSILQAIVLGVVQGITEFLPVSSSGHLQLARELLGVHLTESLTFDVALHCGTVCSTIVVLWREVWEILRGIFSVRWNESHTYAAKIVVSMIPVAIVGFAFKDSIEELLASDYNLLIVGSMLIITSLLLWVAHKSPATAGEGRDISFRDSLIIGIAQAMAVLPGLSRSGSTIATGILLGDDRSKVAKFSFLMVLVPILGNTLLDLIKGGGEIVVEGVSSGAMAAGFVSSFVVGALACRAMIEIVKRGKLIYFALYCAIVGLLSIGAFIL
ncbi:MAG: undecaprenyl-diphosphate phosphatase [Rikenellaceae bacterium]